MILATFQPKQAKTLGNRVKALFGFGGRGETDVAATPMTCFAARNPDEFLTGAALFADDGATVLRIFDIDDYTACDLLAWRQSGGARTQEPAGDAAPEEVAYIVPANARLTPIAQVDVEDFIMEGRYEVPTIISYEGKKMTKDMQGLGILMVNLFGVAKAELRKEHDADARARLARRLFIWNFGRPYVGRALEFTGVYDLVPIMFAFEDTDEAKRTAEAITDRLWGFSAADGPTQAQLDEARAAAAEALDATYAFMSSEIDVQPDDPCPCGSGRAYKDCHANRVTLPVRTVDELHL